MYREKESETEFFEIVKRAYEKGNKERTITIEKLIKEIKSDLLKMKIG